MLSLQIACINTKCPQISQDTTKNPSCGHLVFILFSQVLKKASAARRQNYVQLIQLNNSFTSFIPLHLLSRSFVPLQQLRSFRSYNYDHSIRSASLVPPLPLYTVPCTSCIPQFRVPSGSTRFARSFHSLRCIHYIHLLFPFHSLTRRRFRFIHSVHDLFRFIRLT